MKKIFIFLVLLALLSCSKHGPVDPEISDNDRSTQSFYTEQLIFEGDDINGTCFYYDADICTILEGPGQEGDNEGEIWDHGVYDNNWCVAVALKEVDSGSSTRNICLKFLSDDGTSASISPEYTVTAENDVEIEGNICLARVAACYFFGNDDGEGGTNTTYVEVSIIYQILLPESTQWEIRIARTGFDPEMFVTPADEWDPIEKVWSFDRHIADIPFPISGTWGDDNSDTGDGMLEGDIAYDPEQGTSLYQGNGDLYFVWTWYHDTLGAYYPEGPRVFAAQLIRDDEYTGEPDDDIFSVYGPLVIQKLHATYIDAVCYGFQPRIDIGSWAFPNIFPRWKVSVIFTAGDVVLFPHLVDWLAGTELISMNQIEEIDLDYLALGSSGQKNSGFMPYIDVGQEEDNLCALTWTQVRDNGWFSNDTTVTYIDSNGDYGSLSTADSEDIMASFSSSSVCVRGDDGDYSVSDLSYLECLNPNSYRWKPSAISVRTNPAPLLGWDPSDEYNTLSDTVYGDYDYGSQYINWHGMSSSCSLDSGYYWTVWSTPSNAGGDFNLTFVYGVYGRNTYVHE
ncbi:MAG: hypothetical protein NTY09_06225 [bacterium]|nr:hypothetical protein [bacterium]